MPLTDPARNGLSTASAPTFDGYVRADSGRGYGARIGPTPSSQGNDPSTTMQASRDSNSMSKIVVPKDDRPPYYMRLMISDYERANWLQVGSLTPSLTIELPIPQSLVDAHTVLWQAEEIGLTGALTMHAAGGFTDTTLGGPAKAAGRALIGGAANLAGRVGEAVGLGFGQGLQASLGLAINNYLTMMLQGPAYKEHEFRWKVSPNSAAESEELVKLYREVNNAQAVGLSPTFGSAFFSYPKIFQLEFVHDEADMGKMLYRFKPCVLRSSAWNFMPMGAAFYGETHAPESLEFSFRFVELEFWMNGDFK